MGIQDHREAYGRSGGALRAWNSTLVEDFEGRYDRLKANGGHINDYRRLRGDIADAANAVARSKNWNTAKDQPVFDGLTAFASILDCEIEMQRTVNSALGLGDEGRPSTWVNAETGQPVAVYDSTSSIATDRGRPTVTFGEIVAARLFGEQIAGNRREVVRAALSEGTDSAGGYTVPTHVLPQFIDKLRAKSVFVQAGARTLMLDTAVTKIARISGDPTAAWRAESAAITVSDPTFSALTFAPKSLAVIVKMSRELLADSVNIAEAVETAVINSMSVELDRACLLGSGTSNQPLGLSGTSGISTLSMGTNGATPTSYANLLDMVYQLEAANARGNTAAIWNARTARTFRGLVDTTNQPLRAPAPLDTLPQLSTSSIPINQVQGTSGSVCSSVFMGYWPSAIVGIREAINVRMLPELYAATGEVGFVAHLRADVGFEHPEEFVMLTGIKP